MKLSIQDYQVCISSAYIITTGIFVQSLFVLAIGIIGFYAYEASLKAYMNSK